MLVGRDARVRRGLVETRAHQALHALADRDRAVPVEERGRFGPAARAGIDVVAAVQRADRHAFVGEDLVAGHQRAVLRDGDRLAVERGLLAADPQRAGGRVLVLADRHALVADRHRAVAEVARAEAAGAAHDAGRQRLDLLRAGREAGVEQERRRIAREPFGVAGREIVAELAGRIGRAAVCGGLGREARAGFDARRELRRIAAGARDDPRGRGRAARERQRLAGPADAERHEVDVVRACAGVERADRAVVIHAVAEVVARVHDGRRRGRVHQPRAGRIERDAERRAEHRRVEQAAGHFEREPADQHAEVHVARAERVHHAFPPAVVVRGVVAVDLRGAVRVVAGRDVERAVRRQLVVVDEVADARVFRTLVVDVMRVAARVRHLEDRARHQPRVLRRVDDRHHVHARRRAAADLQQLVAHLVDRVELLLIAELRGVRIVARAVRRQADRDADEVALPRVVELAEIDRRAMLRRLAGLVEQRLRQLAAVRAEEIGQRLRVVLLVGFGLGVAQPLVEVRVEFVEQHLLVQRFAQQLRLLDVLVRLVELRARVRQLLRIRIHDERHRRGQRDIGGRALRLRHRQQARRRADAVIAVPGVVLLLQVVHLALQLRLLRLRVDQRLLRRALVDGRGHPVVRLVQRGRDGLDALDRQRRRIVRDAHRAVVVLVLHAGRDVVVVDCERVAVCGDVAVVRETRAVLRFRQLRVRVAEIEVDLRILDHRARVVVMPLRRCLLRGVVLRLQVRDLPVRVQHLQVAAAHARARLRVVQQVLLRGDGRVHHGRAVLARHRVAGDLDVRDLRRVGGGVQARVRIVRVVGGAFEVRLRVFRLQLVGRVDHAVERRELVVHAADADVHRVRIVAVRRVRLKLREREVRVRDVGVVARLCFG
ncbi:hypothetical protein BST28156_06913 [Burkholderia stagnalis]|nr:hypothetical protein BST28156_06913 [Burkholderia stagnalis]